MKNETSGGIKTSPTESFSNIKEKLFQINSNVTSNDVSSLIEREEEEEIEEFEENENMKTASLRNITEDKDKTSSGMKEDDIISHASSVENKVKIYSKSEIQEKILIIFKNFSSYSTEEKNFFLSQQTLIKLFKKINLFEGNGLKLNEFDIILRKVNRNPHSSKFSEKQFFNLIVRLSEKLNPIEFKNDSKFCVSSFFSDNFESLINEIQQAKDKNSFDFKIHKPSGSSYDIIESVINNPISEEVIKIINSLYIPIKEIYLKYFQFEIELKIEKKKLREESLKSLMEFSKDFEILPYFINLNQLVVYYNTITRSDFSNSISLFDSKREIGSFYTLSKFLSSFIHFSEIFHVKTNKMNPANTKVSDVDKLLLFLEKLENSNGLLSFERKINRPHSGGLSLIPAKYFLDKLNLNLQKDSNFNPMKKSKLTLNEIEDKKLRNLLKVGDDVLNLINSKIDILKEVFFYYCKFGEKLTPANLNFSSFLKFLRDCEVISELPDEIKKKIKNEKDCEKGFISNTRKKKTASSSQEENKIYTKFITNLLNVNGVAGKLSESDVHIIYSKLTGTSDKEDFSDLNNVSFINSRNFSNFEDNLINGFLKEKKHNYNQNKSNSGGKLINFNLFLKSFELIAIRLFRGTKLDQAVTKFFEEHLDKFILNNFKYSSDKNEKLNSHNYLKKKQELQNLLKEIRPIFVFIYKGYSDLNKFMDFNSFHEFYKVFDIFPDLINLVQLKSLFDSVCSKINKLNDDPNLDAIYNGPKRNNHKIISKKTSPDKLIDFNLFLESISTIAGFLLFDVEISEEDKFMYILERMNKSKGFNKLQKKIGTTFTSSKDFQLIFSRLKDGYPGFYNFNSDQQTFLQNSDLLGKIFD